MNTQSQFGFGEYSTTQQNTERFFFDKTHNLHPDFRFTGTCVIRN